MDQGERSVLLCMGSYQGEGDEMISSQREHHLLLFQDIMRMGGQILHHAAGVARGKRKVPVVLHLQQVWQRKPPGPTVFFPCQVRRGQANAGGSRSCTCAPGGGKIKGYSCEH